MRGGEEREKRGGDGMGKEEKGGGKGDREGRKGTEEGPTKNSCRGGPECEVTPLILSKRINISSIFFTMV